MNAGVVILEYASAVREEKKSTDGITAQLRQLDLHDSKKFMFYEKHNISTQLYPWLN